MARGEDNYSSLPSKAAVWDASTGLIDFGIWGICPVFQWRVQKLCERPGVECNARRTLRSTRKLCYRKDARAMRAI